MSDRFPRVLVGAVPAVLAAGFAIPLTGSGPPVRPLLTLRGSAEGSRFGAAVAGVGDLDGDGRGEVIVGAPFERAGGTVRGTARVFSSRDGAERFFFTGDSAHGRFGASVGGGGDLNGDGVPDLVVGAPQGDPPEGCVIAFSGRSGRRLWKSVGDAPGDRFGHACDIVGDLDGDGAAEVSVGAPHADAGGTNAGLVAILSGRDGTRLFEHRGEAWDLLGTSVGRAGDLDGDGLEEVLCGAPLADSAAFNAGSAYVLSGRDGAIRHAFHGAAAGDRLGEAVRGGGDVDGDGVPDLLLGIPGADRGAIDCGAVQVRSGAHGGLLLEVTGSEAGEFLCAAASPGDLDGDGLADLVLGSATASGAARQGGRLRVVSGASGGELLVVEGGGANDWLGAAVTAPGDLDADGIGDFAAGAPGHDDFPPETGYVHLFSGRVVPRRSRSK